MVDARFLRPGFSFALAHAVEECGEFLAAAGKTQRWGPASYDPTIPPEQREPNLDWLEREASDLRGALDRLDAAIAKAGRNALLAA